jgi:hypothetical protein
MSARALLLPPAIVGSSFAAAQSLEPSGYTLNDHAAAKFVRATQQLVSAGQKGPSTHGGLGGFHLAKLKATLA